MTRHQLELIVTHMDYYTPKVKMRLKTGIVQMGHIIILKK